MPVDVSRRTLLKGVFALGGAAAVNAAFGGTAAAQSADHPAAGDTTADNGDILQRESLFALYSGNEPEGTIFISNERRTLYMVVGRLQMEGLADTLRQLGLPASSDARYALAFPVAIGEEGLAMPVGSQYEIRQRQEWPEWRPTANIRRRIPSLRDVSVVPAGPGNPMGRYAFYLFDRQGRDTLFRIHGTNDETTIGRAVSSGCVRLSGVHIAGLYNGFTIAENGQDIPGIDRIVKVSTHRDAVPGITDPQYDRARPAGNIPRISLP